jgi:hypothetical protein
MQTARRMVNSGERVRRSPRREGSARINGDIKAVTKICLNCHGLASGGSVDDNLKRGTPNLTLCRPVDLPPRGIDETIFGRPRPSISPIPRRRWHGEALARRRPRLSYHVGETAPLVRIASRRHTVTTINNNNNPIPMRNTTDREDACLTPAPLRAPYEYML